jgi:hypothetical protein
MMLKFLYWASLVIVALHGLIHIMGFVAYWPIAAVTELPYKTTVAGGLWDVGPLGMKLYAALWLLGAVSFLAAVAGVAMRRRWWRRAMLISIILSTGLIALDWAPSFRGAIINAAILAVMATPRKAAAGIKLS